jgi:hypothetical protein
MENNVRLVRASDALRSAAADLVGRALTSWRMIDEHRLEMEKPMPRGGRKAQRLNRPGEVMA